MSSAFDFAAASPAPTSVELGGASSWGRSAKKKPAAKPNPFDVEDFGDNNDLEASLLDHESENVSSQERALLSRISNVRYITEEELMDEEMRARDNAMGRLNQDVHKIHEVFSDLRDIVGEQQEAVDQVEEDVEAAHSRAESGIKQLHGAVKKQRAGSRCFIIALATLVFIACLVALAVAVGPRLLKPARR